MRARRAWAWPLVPVYRAGLAVKEALRGEPKRLRWPVVSVGSVAAGGAGKTPVVIALAKLLQGRGWDVDVLSRGYGREGKGVEWVASLGDDAARRFGDEPVVIAREAAVPVWVGADRYKAGVEAEIQVCGAGEEKQIPFGNDNKKGNDKSKGNDKDKGKGNDNDNNNGQDLTQRARREDAKDATARREDAKDATAAVSAGEGVAELMGARRVHLLDDGFQHRQLAREFDVVLVTAEDLEDALLPAGNLREPFEALRMSDAVVVREEELETVRGPVWALMRQGAQMWLVRRRLHFPAPLFVFGAGLRPVAFCAIARPEGFAAMLAEAGCGVVETVAFADHHAYAMSDVERVVEVARGLNATGFVTTEKDAVKLTAAMRERLESVGPLMVARLEAEFADKDAVMRAVESRIGERSR